MSHQREPDWIEPHASPRSHIDSLGELQPVAVVPACIRDILDWWDGLHPVARADFEEIHPELPAVLVRIIDEFGGEATT